MLACWHVGGQWAGRTRHSSHPAGSWLWTSPVSCCFGCTHPLKPAAAACCPLPCRQCLVVLCDPAPAGPGPAHGGVQEVQVSSPRPICLPACLAARLLPCMSFRPPARLPTRLPACSPFLAPKHWQSSSLHSPAGWHSCLPCPVFLLSITAAGLTILCSLSTCRAWQLVPAGSNCLPPDTLRS